MPLSREELADLVDQLRTGLRLLSLELTAWEADRGKARALLEDAKDFAQTLLDSRESLSWFECEGLIEGHLREVRAYLATPGKPEGEPP